MQSICRHSNDANTQPSMHESFIQECPFVRRHTAIFSSLTVEDEIRRDYRTADDSGAIEESLGHAAGIRARDLAARLYVGATEGMLEGISRVDEGSDGRDRFCGEGFRSRRVMKCTACGLSSFGKLFEACGDGHGPTKNEGHDYCCVCRFPSDCV